MSDDVIGYLTARVTSLESTVKQQSTTLSLLADRHQSLERHADTSKHSSEQLGMQLHKLCSDYAAVNDQHAQLQQHLSTQADRVTKLESYAHDQTALMRKLDETVESRVQALEQRAHAVVSSCIQRIEAAEQVARSEEQSNKSRWHECDHALRRVESSAHDGVQSVRQHLDAELAKLKQHHDALQSFTRESLTSLHSSVTSDLEAVSKRQDAALQSVIQERVRVPSAHDEHLQQELSQLRQQVGANMVTLRQRMEEMQRELRESLQTSYNSIAGEFANLTQYCVDLDNRLRSSTSGLTSRVSQLEGSVEKMESNWRAAVMELRAVLDTKTSDAANRTDALSKSLQSVKAEVEQSVASWTERMNQTFTEARVQLHSVSIAPQHQTGELVREHGSRLQHLQEESSRMQIQLQDRLSEVNRAIADLRQITEAAFRAMHVDLVDRVGVVQSAVQQCYKTSEVDTRIDGALQHLWQECNHSFVTKSGVELVQSKLAVLEGAVRVELISLMEGVKQAQRDSAEPKREGASSSSLLAAPNDSSDGRDTNARANKHSHPHHAPQKKHGSTLQEAIAAAREHAASSGAATTTMQQPRARSSVARLLGAADRAVLREPTDGSVVSVREFNQLKSVLHRELEDLWGALDRMATEDYATQAALENFLLESNDNLSADVRKRVQRHESKVMSLLRYLRDQVDVLQRLPGMMLMSGSRDAAALPAVPFMTSTEAASFTAMPPPTHPLDPYPMLNRNAISRSDELLQQQQQQQQQQAAMQAMRQDNVYAWSTAAGMTPPPPPPPPPHDSFLPVPMMPTLHPAAMPQSEHVAELMVTEPMQAGPSLQYPTFEQRFKEPLYPPELLAPKSNRLVPDHDIIRADNDNSNTNHTSGAAHTFSDNNIQAPNISSNNNHRADDDASIASVAPGLVMQDVLKAEGTQKLVARPSSSSSASTTSPVVARSNSASMPAGEAPMRRKNTLRANQVDQASANAHSINNQSKPSITELRPARSGANGPPAPPASGEAKNSVSPVSPSDRAGMSNLGYVQRRLLNEALIIDTSSESSQFSDVDSRSGSFCSVPQSQTDKSPAPPIPTPPDTVHVQQQEHPRPRRRSTLNGAEKPPSTTGAADGPSHSAERGNAPQSIMRRRNSKDSRIPSPGRRNRAPLVNIMPPTNTAKTAKGSSKRSILKK